MKTVMTLKLEADDDSIVLITGILLIVTPPLKESLRTDEERISGSQIKTVSHGLPWWSRG